MTSGVTARRGASSLHPAPLSVSARLSTCTPLQVENPPSNSRLGDLEGHHELPTFDRGELLAGMPDPVLDPGGCGFLELEEL
jgi:hypothetical protein